MDITYFLPATPENVTRVIAIGRARPHLVATRWTLAINGLQFVEGSREYGIGGKRVLTVMLDAQMEGLRSVSTPS